jgi:hypothetical protein
MFAPTTDVVGVFNAIAEDAGVFTATAEDAGVFTATADGAGLFAATTDDGRVPFEIVQLFVEAREAMLAGAGEARRFAMLLFMPHPREPT